MENNVVFTSICLDMGLNRNSKSQMAHALPPTMQVLNSILSTDRDCQRSCSPLPTSTSLDAITSPISPLRLPNPVSIVTDLENTGLTASIAASISGAYMRSCLTYKSSVLDKYQEACNTGILTNDTRAQLSYILRLRYLSKLEEWKKKTISTTLIRTRELQSIQRKPGSCTGNFNYVHSLL